jgi:flagellin
MALLGINTAKNDTAKLYLDDDKVLLLSDLTQALKNANYGISLAETAEGSVYETTNWLQRMRNLIVTARSPEHSPNLTAIQKELSQCTEEINRISIQTSFEGRSLFRIENKVNFQVGVPDAQCITLALPMMNATALGVDRIDVSGVADQTEDYLARIDSAIEQVNSLRATLVETQNHLQAIAANLGARIDDITR